MSDFHPHINARAYATPRLAARAQVLASARIDGRVPASSRSAWQKELLAIIHELTRRAQAVIVTYR